MTGTAGEAAKQRKRAIEHAITTHGGKFAANPMKGATQYILSTRVRMRDYDMRTLAASAHYDIVTEQWLERCCAAEALVPPHFTELLGMTPRTRTR